MKRHTIHTDLFDLARFVDGIVQLWDDPETAFAFVEGKYADFGTLCLGDDADDAGDTPLDWLNHGHTLFGQFARRDDDRYTLPGGDVLDVSDVGDDDDDSLLDESVSYGFLLQVKDGQLRIESAVLQDSTGECLVTAVEDAGVFEEKMTAFVRSMVRKG